MSDNTEITSKNWPTLKGERLVLRPICQADLPMIKTWYEDPEIRALTAVTKEMSPKELESWFDTVSKDPGRRWFAVIDEGGSVIGEAGLLRIFPAWRTTDMTIILGDKASWGKGYGTEAGKLIQDLLSSLLTPSATLPATGYPSGYRSWQAM